MKTKVSMGGHSPQHMLAVCIDDVGLHVGVNRAALALVQAGRVSSWSCMVDGLAFAAVPALAQACAGLPLELGLHLNFTERLPGAQVWPLKDMLRQAYVRGLDRKVLAREVRRQFDAFEQHFGRAPDFVDGHQHVHQLPMVRTTLADEMNRRFGASPHRPWVRRCARPSNAHTLPLGAWFKALGWVFGLSQGGLPDTEWAKALLIERLGCADLSHQAQRHGWPQNQHLLGVRSLSADQAAFLKQLEAWLTSCQAQDLLMVHPASGRENVGEDRILPTRLAEYDVLMSDAFGQLLAAQHIDIRPLTGRL